MTIKNIAILGITGVAATALFASTAAEAHARDKGGGMMHMEQRSDMKKGMQMSGNIDKHFIEQMIPHHEDAIAMAEMALERAKHDETKTLARTIIADQSREIKDMRSWYKQWYGTDVPQTAMTGMHQMDMKDLENAEDFDKAFIKEMIPHHRMAVRMAHMLSNRTTRPEMKQLAQDIKTSQTQEIKQMRTWYSQWYR